MGGSQGRRLYSFFLLNAVEACSFFVFYVYSVARKTGAALYAIVHYKTDGQYGITSTNWLSGDCKKTYWPKKESNACTRLKCRKWMVDMKKHFKSYDVDVLKYAGLLFNLCSDCISIGDLTLPAHVMLVCLQRTTKALKDDWNG